MRRGTPARVVALALAVILPMVAPPAVAPLVASTARIVVAPAAVAAGGALVPAVPAQRGRARGGFHWAQTRDGR